jgi:hypothetical protein
VIDTLKQLGRHLWAQASYRGRSDWPPGWLVAGAVCTALITLIWVIIPLVRVLVAWAADGVAASGCTTGH